MQFVTLRGTASHIRTADYQGQSVLVVPVIALVPGVIRAMNSPAPELVPASTIAKEPQCWNGRPVTLGHPIRNGRPTSANDPEVLSSCGFGTIFNARVAGSKLLLDAYIDPARATRIGAAQLVQRLRAGEIVDVSVGAFVHTRPTPGASHNGSRYDAEWVTMTPDHLAILPNTHGACSVAAGCGTRAAEVMKTVPEWLQHYAQKLKGEQPREHAVPDPYSGLTRCASPSPFDDPHYQPYGAAPDGYAIARAKKEKR